MIMMRTVLCVLTVALCCVCIVVVAAEEARGPHDGGALQTTASGNENPDEGREAERLKNTVNEGDCEAPSGEGREKKPCEGPPTPVPSLAKTQKGEEATKGRTDSHTSQPQTASAPGVSVVSTEGQSTQQGRPGDASEQEENQQGNERSHQKPISGPETVKPGTTQVPSSRDQETSAEHAQGSNTQPHEDRDTQPSSSSVNQSSNSETENASETAAGANGNIATNAESESTSNEEGVEGNTVTTTTSTTTTTTTTTLPPELTNNKKGDADSSSSSISSSVWVRVPLLIVVTLACILVC
ncbi:uncharacterized protein TM35_000451720 [Trypanosoma theileri]|uniref:Mucin TcMUCII n=1 Tax=Trypanosoma theileri TaxID=67003 RepID=A0A1X0NI47_9TRYP|nr:uncharacterized protein TM35_000451720 [Trypanosoma theileri]ORC84434.1 hypothetical protein TM35_000451720 [Trypanosoma theileri]